MSDQEQYEVEFIIGKRKKRGRLEYLVKWKGWDRPQDNSWLPLKHLKCQELIEEFEAKTGAKGQFMAESEEVVDVSNRENPAAGQKKKEKKKEKKKIVQVQRRKTLTPGQRRKEMKGPRVRLGFARGLTPEKITGVVQLPGNNEIIHLVKWEGIDEADMIPAKETNKEIPQLVIKFYEERLSFSSEDEDE